MRALVLSWTVLSLTACAGGPLESGDEPWLEFSWPEADQLFQGDSLWLGADGAYSIDLGSGRVLWLFGDSWVGLDGSGDRRNANMVSNTLGIQSGYDPTAADIEFFWGVEPGGQARGFFPDLDGVRYWPGHGVRLAGGLLLFLMEVHPGDADLGFRVARSRAIWISNPDADPPSWRWERLDLPDTQRLIVLGSGGVLVHEDWLYAFGSRKVEIGHHAHLARWPLEAASLGDLSGIEWWAGEEGGWQPGTDAEARAETVFGAGQTEFTVHYDSVAGRFVEYQTHLFGRSAIVRRTAERLTGPWSAMDTVFLPAQNTYPEIMVYQGKAHPYLEGGSPVLTYATNSFDFDDHFNRPWLYFPRFVRLDGDEVESRSN